jgi:hypothetical protein
VDLNNSNKVKSKLFELSGKKQPKCFSPGNPWHNQCPLYWGHLKSLGGTIGDKGPLRGRGTKKFGDKVSRNDVGVIRNELGPL